MSSQLLAEKPVKLRSKRIKKYPAPRIIVLDAGYFLYPAFFDAQADVPECVAGFCPELCPVQPCDISLSDSDVLSLLFSDISVRVASRPQGKYNILSGKCRTQETAFVDFR